MIMEIAVDTDNISMIASWDKGSPEYFPEMIMPLLI